MTTPCADCGRYIPRREMLSTDGTARFRHTPLNEFGPEVSEWICGACDSGSHPQDQDAERLGAEHGRAARQGIARKAGA